MATAVETEHMTPDELRIYLGGVSLRTLARWRCERTGPAYHKAGKRVLYRRQDVDEWLAQNRMEPVAGPRRALNRAAARLPAAERGFVKEKAGTVRWRGIGLAARNCPQCEGEGCRWCEQ